MKFAATGCVLVALMTASSALAFAGGDPAAAVPCALAAPPETAGDEPSDIVIPALLPVTIAIAAPVSSRTAEIGACFPIALAEPIVIDGAEIIPAGAQGLGQVVHAAKARAAGKGGELILAARFIQHDGLTVSLRSLEFSKAGKDHLDAALAASATLPMLGYLFSGGNVWVESGTVASAKVRHAVRISRSGIAQGDAVSRMEGKP